MKRSYTCPCGVTISADSDADLECEIAIHERHFRAGFYDNQDGGPTYHPQVGSMIHRDYLKDFAPRTRNGSDPA